jgi:ATP-dependent helicase HepA
MKRFFAGQRWVSQTELELGLGRVVKTDARTVLFEFPAAGQQRIYRLSGAPIQRFQLLVGEMARSAKGESFLIEEIEEVDGVLIYCGKGKRLPESDLHHRMNARRDNLFERLAENQGDTNKNFGLRSSAQSIRSRWLASPVRGMVGPRVDLIPHQYYICHRACSGSGLPRLMLCDEVGLGKTIEAGMIWHALKTRGRVTRALIIVPESLKHQWIVEMLRRFNQFFTLIDPGFIQSLAASGDNIGNPFAARNEVLVTFEYMMEEPILVRDLLKVNWDLLIVDEAHHLVCEGDYKSPQYMITNAIAAKSKGMLLLTGTPLQLHPEAHFNRLRMLDPARFQDFATFQNDGEQYRKLVVDLNKLLKISQEADTQLTWEQIQKTVPKNSPIRTWLESVSTHSLEAGEWVRRIVDALGTGSVVFRNSRKGVGGFPKRILHPHPLKPAKHYRRAVELSMERDQDDSIALAINGLLMREIPEAWVQDERIEWLKGFLKQMKEEKILLICSDREVVKALAHLLPMIIGTDEFVLFHENMDLVARDRAAAWFARKNGARLLVASEIGSEGRNFQFAHHLVMFDLPLDASLLEQRIGRLDRIGQREKIHLHVPFTEGSAQDALFAWYNEGLDAFLNPLMGSGEVYVQYENELLEAMVTPAESLGKFRKEVLPQARKMVETLRKEVEEGRDRLLEFNSRNNAVAKELVHQVDELDADRELHDLVLKALDVFGVEVEDGSLPRSLILQTTPLMKHDIPGLSEKSRIVTSVPVAGSEGESDEAYNEIGVTVTMDRHEALDHDAIDFLSWEHPTCQGILDLLTMEEFGTATMALWDKAPFKGIVMQYNFLHEPVLSPDWGLGDLAGPAVVHALVDGKGEDFSEFLEDMLDLELKTCALPQGSALTAKMKFFATDGLASARKIATAISQELAQKAMEKVGERLEREYQRAQYLLALQGKAEDSAILVDFRKSIVERKKAVQTPQLRLDAIRLVVCR